MFMEHGAYIYEQMDVSMIEAAKNFAIGYNPDDVFRIYIALQLIE